MKRRAFAERAGALATLAVAGCVSEPGGDVPAEGTAGGTDTPTPTPTEGTDEPTDTGTPAGTDEPSPGDPAAEFEVRDVSSGSGENTATVAFEEDAVTVDGVIGGRNGCYTARLREAETAEGALRVLVEAYEDRAEDEACTDALVDIEYAATVGFDDALPERVVVEHDSMGEVRTVADESR